MFIELTVYDTGMSFCIAVESIIWIQPAKQVDHVVDGTLLMIEGQGMELRVKEQYEFIKSKLRMI